MSTRPKTSFRVKVSSRGTITLPKELRARNQIQKGDNLKLIALDKDLVIMRSQKSLVNEIADELAKEWTSAGASLEEMLNTLQKVRAEYDTN